ncbi:hypothetical protein RclHR1_17150004 [Rhizophagus clarus]|nr:hypothetical protein RclHR1_17150004 [Rhizophagus clarus]
MNQLQVVEKTSTKCVNSSYKPISKKKTSNTTRLSSRLILPKPVQQTLPLPQQQQQIGSPLPQQQQIASLPQQQQQEVQQQIDPVLYENYNETILVSSYFQDDANQDQDIDERSGGWKDSEIKILLDYLQENFSSWSKGNKTKFYNDVARNILPNKEPIAIKKRKDWYWYDTLDSIFGTRKNIAPSFLANKLTSDKIDDNEEENEVKKVGNKKQKVRSNVEVMATAIVEMNQT